MYDINEYEIDTDMTDVFSKVSSFYSKDGVSYESKFCNFVINKIEKG